MARVLVWLLPITLVAYLLSLPFYSRPFLRGDIAGVYWLVVGANYILALLFALNLIAIAMMLRWAQSRDVHPTSKRLTVLGAKLLGVIACLCAAVSLIATPIRHYSSAAFAGQTYYLAGTSPTAAGPGRAMLFRCDGAGLICRQMWTDEFSASSPGEAPLLVLDSETQTLSVHLAAPGSGQSRLLHTYRPR